MKAVVIEKTYPMGENPMHTINNVTCIANACESLLITNNDDVFEYKINDLQEVHLYYVE